MKNLNIYVQNEKCVFDFLRNKHKRHQFNQKITLTVMCLMSKYLLNFGLERSINHIIVETVLEVTEPFIMRPKFELEIDTKN